MKKRLISTCILLSMIVGLSGCGSKVSDSSESSETFDSAIVEDVTETTDVTSDDTATDVAPVSKMSDYPDVSYFVSYLRIITEIVDACYANEHTNIMMSPLSLDIAFAMVANGADDVTRKNMRFILVTN